MATREHYKRVILITAFGGLFLAAAFVPMFMDFRRQKKREVEAMERLTAPGEFVIETIRNQGSPLFVKTLSEWSAAGRFPEMAAPDETNRVYAWKLNWVNVETEAGSASGAAYRYAFTDAGGRILKSFWAER